MWSPLGPQPEDGKIAAHGDTIEIVPARGAWKNQKREFGFGRL
jgi:hypothetical protein